MLTYIFSFLILVSVSSAENDDAFMRQIWSPYCPGISLLECTSSQAEVLRSNIRSRLKAGIPAEEIWQDLRKTYGDQIRMEPAGRGRELLAYLLPWFIFGFLFSLVLLWLKHRRAQKLAPLKTEKIDGRLHQKILHDLNEKFQ